jgi:hypothetical protein
MPLGHIHVAPEKGVTHAELTGMSAWNATEKRENYEAG